jgi:hypothetical protein
MCCGGVSSRQRIVLAVTPKLSGFDRSDCVDSLKFVQVIAATHSVHCRNVAVFVF